MSARSYTLDEVERQADALPDDLASLTPAAVAGARQVSQRLGRPDAVVLVGSGDSRHAALAARPAFVAAGVAVRVVAATTLARELRGSPGLLARRPAVIGVSASGSNPAVVEALAQARAGGLDTVAVTGQADSPLAQAAAATLRLDPGSSRPSPGIRTYQASLLALLHLARALAGPAGADAFTALDELDGRDALDGLDALDELDGRDGLAGLAGLRDAQRRALAAARQAAVPVARMLRDVPLVRIVAADSAAGAATHLAAKLTEVAGVPSAAVELDDWWHVHRFGHPVAHPVVFLVPPGVDRDAAVAYAVRTAERRRLLVIAGESDTGARAAAELAVSVPDGVPELVRPLVDSAGAGVLAAALARLLGRTPFSCP